MRGGRASSRSDIRTFSSSVGMPLDRIEIARGLDDISSPDVKVSGEGREQGNGPVILDPVGVVCCGARARQEARGPDGSKEPCCFNDF